MGIELLNLVFRQHCWDRYLRFDRDGQRFFFSPFKQEPKRIVWNLNGKRTREVTTRHFGMKNQKTERGKDSHSVGVIKRFELSSFIFQWAYSCE